MKLDLTVAAYIVKDSKVLLINHKKLCRWLPPGGHIEPNETPDDALKREVLEETGLKIEILNKVILHAGKSTIEELAVPIYTNVHSVGDHNHYGLFYLCKPLTDKIKIQPEEINGCKWFELKDIADEDVKAIASEALKIASDFRV